MELFAYITSRGLTTSACSRLIPANRKSSINGRVLAFILCALIFSSPAISLADNFRCPNGSIVSTGDSIGVVATKCDKPSYIAKRIEPEESTRGRAVYIEVEEWTYNEGPDRLLHFLTFRNGILVEIRSGGYGK